MTGREWPPPDSAHVNTQISHRYNRCSHSSRESLDYNLFLFLTFLSSVWRRYSSSVWTKICIFNVHNESYCKSHPTQTPAATRAMSAGSVDPSHTLTHTLAHLLCCQKYPLVCQICGQSIIYSSLNDICPLAVPEYLRKQPGHFLMNLYICILRSKIHVGMNGFCGWQPQRWEERGSRHSETGFREESKIL